VADEPSTNARGDVMNIGYVRVSSHDQNVDRQLEGIVLDKIYTDTVSGKDINRPQLKKCLAALKKGDVLHVHSIDRMTRNLQDLLTLLNEMEKRGVSVKFYKEKLVFNNDCTPFQKLHMQIIGAVAEFERAFIRERQREGIAIAKAQGKYKGRKRLMDDVQSQKIVDLALSGIPVKKISEQFHVSRQTIYRILQNAKMEKNSITK